MSEHTPGPWTKECGCILDSRRNIVASRWSWRHADKDENTLRSDEAIHPVEADANCRLIAAAPELLAAIEGLMPMLDAHQAQDKSLTDVGHQTINAARDALAKCSPS